MNKESEFCRKCGFSFSNPCEGCRRLESWEKKDIEKRLSVFPPLIRRDLKYYENYSFPELQSRYIYGESGTGKTTYACGIALHEMKKAIVYRKSFPNIEFVDSVSLFLKIKETFNDSTLKETEVLKKYTDCDLLILDDLGIENKCSDWAYQILYYIINSKYLNLKHLIITSNYDLKELAKKWQEERIVSRIMEMCFMDKREKVYRVKKVI